MYQRLAIAAVFCLGLLDGHPQGLAAAVRRVGCCSSGPGRRPRASAGTAPGAPDRRAVIALTAVRWFGREEPGRDRLRRERQGARES
jgi:hypothetical protein